MLLFACRNRDIADEGSLSEHEISMGEDSSGRPETGDRNISKKDKNNISFLRVCIKYFMSFSFLTDILSFTINLYLLRYNLNLIL